MKKTFKFTLKLDDEEKSLSAKDGLPFQKLGELLIALYKAVDSGENTKCTLSEIITGSYGAILSTDDERTYSNLEIVHRNIEQNPIDELEGAQRDYAYTLKRVLGGKLRIIALNNENKEVASIKDLDKTTNIETYYSTETLYGVLSQIGSPHVNATKKYIYIDGVDYRISVTREQDSDLKQYYTTHKLRVKVRHKRSAADGHIMSAEMLSFVVVEQTDIIDTLKDIGYVDLEILKEAHTMDEIVNRIYGTE